MRILEDRYLGAYSDLIGYQIDNLIRDFNFSESNTDLGYKIQASAVFSSNIEGNTVDLNSFMNFKLSREKFKPGREIEEIENLILAYEYAMKNRLTEQNFLQCHKLLSKSLVIKSNQGKYRKEKIGVFGPSGLVYLAIEPELVAETMAGFFADLAILQIRKMNHNESFYYASLIHLIFAHIHPFRDGNGRAARLLEKWFLAEKINPQIWKLSSEKYYKENQSDYYNNINLGVNYYELNYENCMPFLLMLPKSLQ